MESGSPLSRRAFVKSAAIAAGGVMIVPRHVLGGVGFRAPSDTMNLAIVGAGGMGLSNAMQLLSENIVAICDVDLAFVDRQVDGRRRNRDGQPNPDGEKVAAAYAKAARHTDFRRMLERQRDIDGVVIATPDHVHAHIALAAMQLGKHVYLQKPLTYSVQEARTLRDAARRMPKVVTQMGNQGHSSDDARLINEWVRAGVLGDVREVHVWTNRPIWPQGLARPERENRPAPEGWGKGANDARLAHAMRGEYPVPPGLDWDLYLGPVQPVPYHPAYHPFNWRGWLDFGVGAIGDMGAHLIDHPYWALDLDYPTTVEATSSPWGGPQGAPVSYPMAMTAHYEFPAKGRRPAVSMDWYDGGLMPPRPAALPESIELPRTGGVIFVGEKGILLHETYGANPRLFPESLRDAAARVPKSMPRVTTSHEMNWVQAAKGEATATAPFEYAAPLTEVMLLGIAALRAGQGRQLRYDGASGAFTNVPDANQYLTRTYRDGWSL